MKTNKALVYAKYNTAMISPKKVAPVMNLVRGMGALEAKITLSFDTTKAAKLTLKVLNSAIANAKNNLNLLEKDLFISDLQVRGGTTLKRGNIVAKGRFSPILKRTSHILVGLSERNGK